MAAVTVTRFVVEIGALCVDAPNRHDAHEFADALQTALALGLERREAGEQLSGSVPLHVDLGDLTLEPLVGRTPGERGRHLAGQIADHIAARRTDDVHARAREIAMARLKDHQRIARRRRTASGDRRRAKATLSRHGERALADSLRGEDGVTFELPHRTAIERRIGSDAPGVVVRTGPGIAALLDAAGAEAATVDGTIYLASDDVGVETLAHEVVHVLQSRRPGGPTSGVLPADHPAELEADRMASGTAAEFAIDEAIGSDVVALRRTTDTAVDDEASEQAFDRAVDPSGRRPVGADGTRDHESDTTVSDEGRSDEGGTGDAAADRDAATGSAAPVLGAVSAELGNVDEPPPTPPDPELVAEASEQLAVQQSPAAVLAAYRDARSSLKAAMQPVLETHLRASRAGEHARAAAATAASPVAVKVDGTAEAPPVRAIATPGSNSERDGLGAAGALPTVDVVPTPTPQRYSANDDIVGKLDWFQQGDAKAVGESLDAVATTDPGIDTDPGPSPEIPRTERSDDRQMDRDRSTARNDAVTARDAAVRAVVDGPGPEVVAPQSFEERRPVSEPPAAGVGEVTRSPVAAEFTTLGLSKDVADQFDADTDAAMTSGVSAAQRDLEGAEQQRDADRRAAHDDADAERKRLEGEADGEQRSVVMENRTAIQAERQATIDAQATAVAEMDRDAERQLVTKRGEVANERRATKKKVAARRVEARRDADAKVQQGERDAAAAKRKAKRDAKKRSWWQRALSFVKKAFAALTAVIGKVFDAVRKGVKFLLDKARNAIKGLIDLAVAAISKLIDGFAALLKGLVTGLLGTVFPELAAKLNAGIDRLANKAKAGVRAVGDKLKAGVDALVDKLQAAINKILDAFEGALKAAVAVVGAVLTGDWAAALKQVLEAALKLVGIAPAKFYAFVGRVMATIGTIVRHPIRFLSHAVRAIVGGVELFAGNFFTHLKAGVIGWLTGALGGALQIPKQFDLAGVFSIVRQVLNLTPEWLRKKAVLLVGEKNVARVEFVWGYIQTLLTGGWSALFEQIKEQLAGVKDAVLDGIKEMLLTKVVMAAITWIASLFNPVGALVKIVMLIWNLYTFIRDQLSRIWAMAQAVVSSIADIAAGVLEPAMKKVEGVLANLLPIAIDLFARLLGLGSFTGKVRGILRKVRRRIDRAVTRLLRKVLKRFRGKQGGQPAPPGKANARRIGPRLRLTDEDGKPHHLDIDVSGRNATVAVHSTMTAATAWLARYRRTTVEQLDEPKRKQAGPALDAADAAQRRLDPEADQLAAARASGAKKKSTSAKKVPTEAEVVAEQKVLAAKIQQLMTLAGDGADTSAFDAHLKTTHQDAKRHIKEALGKLLADKQTGSQLIVKGWPAAKAAVLASKHPFIDKPLLRERKYGEKVQDKLVAVIGTVAKRTGDSKATELAKKLTTTEARKNVISLHVAKPINQGTDRDGRVAVEGHVFGSLSDDQLVKGLTPSVERGIVASGSDSKAGDPAVVAAVDKAGGLIKFFKAMARNQPVSAPGHRTIDPAKWDDEYEKNREYFKNAFRGINRGQHEWIPTELIKDVVNRARKGDSGDAEAAVIWIDVHDTLRSPTKGLVFTPEHAVDVPVGGGVTWRVLQGHPGATYAPVSGRAYDPALAGKQQTTGSPVWHQELSAAFKAAAALPTEKGVKQVVKNAQVSFDKMIWSGAATPAITRGADYRVGRTEAPMTFQDLQAQAKQFRKAPEKVLDAAKDVAAQLKANR